MKDSSNSVSSPRHLLIVDDDPVFRALIGRAAKKRRLHVTVCASMREINPMSAPGLFDAIVMDYYLDGIQEHLKGTHLANVLEATPVLLISSSDHCIASHEPWPQSIRKFIPKRFGADIILDEAIRLLSRPKGGPA